MMNKKGFLPFAAIIIGLVMMIGATAYILSGWSPPPKTVLMDAEYNSTKMAEYWGLCTYRSHITDNKEGAYEHCLKQSEGRKDIGVLCVNHGGRFTTLSNCNTQ